MWKTLTTIAALVMKTAGCSEQPQVSNRIIESPRCWASSGLFRKGDRVRGLANAFYNPDGPLLLASTDCLTMSFNTKFGNEAMGKSILTEMREASTGDAFGGQFYLVRFDGVVEGDGSDPSSLLVSDLDVIRPISNVIEAVEKDMDPRAKEALRAK